MPSTSRNIAFFLAAFLLWTPSRFLLAQDDTTVPPAPKVGNIRVEGLKVLPPESVTAVLKTHSGDVLSIRRVREDIHSLFATGNFEQVDISADGPPTASKVDLVVTVEERPRIHEIRFVGNSKKKPKKLMEKMALAPKHPLDPSQLSADIEEVKKLYREDGYADATVETETQPTADGKGVDLILTVKEGNQVKVGHITLQGVQAFSEKKIKGKIKENREGKKYRSDKLDEDLRHIEEFYRNEGYLRALVTTHTETLSEDGRTMDLALQIQEGVPYTLADLTVEGNEVVPSEDMVKAANLSTGKLLREKDLGESVQRMRTLYLDKGYIYCSVRPLPDYDDETKTVKLKVRVIEGQVAYIQDIKIVGNYKTKDYVIRRELEVKPGEKFEATRIRSSVMNLNNLGFFDEVNPEVEQGDKPGQAVLVFRIKERKTGSIGLGGGYSSVDGMVGNIKFEEANLFGRGQKFNAEWEIGKRLLSYNFGFTEPWLFGTRTSLSLGIFNTNRILDFYTERRLGGSIGVGRRVSKYWSLFDTYLYERVQVKDVAAPYDDPTYSLYIPSSTQSTSSMTPRVVFDNRDNYFDPHSGWRHQISLEIAGGPFGGDNNFLKLIPDSSAFLPLFWKFVLGEHVRLGYAKGYKGAHGFTDVPVYDRFYCGGTDTVRGYGERVIGPGNGAAGGRVLFVWNSEFKYPIAGPLRGVFFWDTGSLWSDMAYVKNDLQSGYGLGIRLTIPGTVMAIRLDYGWPYKSNLPDVSKSGKLHFNLGDIF